MYLRSLVDSLTKLESHNLISMGFRARPYSESVGPAVFQIYVMHPNRSNSPISTVFRPLKPVKVKKILD